MIQLLKLNQKTNNYMPPKMPAEARWCEEKWIKVECWRSRMESLFIHKRKEAFNNIMQTMLGLKDRLIGRRALRTGREWETISQLIWIKVKVGLYRTNGRDWCMGNRQIRSKRGSYNLPLILLLVVASRPPARTKDSTRTGQALKVLTACRQII